MSKGLTTQYLNEILAYCPESGNLMWKERPIGHFSSHRAMKRHNTMRAGRIAGSRIKTPRGSRDAIILSIDAWPHRSHLVIWKMLGREIPKGMFIDHINGDPWDNRLANLRIASNTSNQWNRTAPSNSSTGIKCVTWSKRMNKWKATIRTNGAYFHLGYHHTLGLAAVAHAKASIRHHGIYSPFLRKIQQPEG